MVFGNTFPFIFFIPTDVSALCAAVTLESQESQRFPTGLAKSKVALPAGSLR